MSVEILLIHCLSFQNEALFWHRLLKFAHFDHYTTFVNWFFLLQD